MSLCRFCRKDCSDDVCFSCQNDPEIAFILSFLPKAEDMANIPVLIQYRDSEDTSMTIATDFYKGRAVYYKYQRWNEDYRMFLN